MQERLPFQYSLRALMLFVTACAIACGLFTIWLRSAERQAVAVAEIKRVGGVVYYHSQEDVHEADIAPEYCPPPQPGNDWFSNVRTVMLSQPETTDAALLAVSELRRVQRIRIDGPNGITDVGFSCLGRMKELEELYITHARMTDVGFANLASLTRLRTLLVWDAQITDAGLACVESFTDLTALQVGGIGITDAGLAHLGPLRRLKYLMIIDAPITDEGLVNLEGLKNLGSLWLLNTHVTEAGVERLREKLPRCGVEHVWRR
jgi:hypothetical protein